MRGLCLGLALAMVLPGTTLPAQSDSASTRPPAMVTGGDLARLGAFGVLTLGAYHLDAQSRVAFRGDDAQHGIHDVVAQVGDIYGIGGAAGIGVGLWVGGLMSRNRAVATTGLRALEAMVVAGVVTKGIKGIAGRARPSISPEDHADFEWGRGFGVIDGEYESFPSAHAALSFAFATAVAGEVARSAPRHARTVVIAAYSMATLTAYSRVVADEHWLSDVTFGAGLGMVSGWAVTRWHAARPDNGVDRFFLRPVIEAGPRGETRLGFTAATW